MYTRNNLFEEEIFNCVQDFAEDIETSKLQTSLPEHVECMLMAVLTDDTTTSDSAKWSCSYYMVDHENRILFWMTEFGADYMVGEIDGVTDDRHISTLCDIFLFLSI
jgi:hypothetical protein